MRKVRMFAGLFLLAMFVALTGFVAMQGIIRSDGLWLLTAILISGCAGFLLLAADSTDD